MGVYVQKKGILYVNQIHARDVDTGTVETQSTNRKGMGIIKKGKGEGKYHKLRISYVKLCRQKSQTDS